MGKLPTGIQIWAGLYPFPQLILGLYFTLTRGLLTPSSYIFWSRVLSFLIAGKIHKYKSKQKMQCKLFSRRKRTQGPVHPTPPLWLAGNWITLGKTLKGNEGRKYNSTTTLAVLNQWLDEEFELVLAWNESIEGFIHKMRRLAQKFYNGPLKIYLRNQPFKPETKAPR